LAKLFTKPANLLILDEPTNDLDLETLELLEELLQSYTGTVLLVSHDRAFLDNVVTQSLCFVGKGTGRVIEVTGGYEDWLMIRHQYDNLPILAETTAEEITEPSPEKDLKLTAQIQPPSPQATVKKSKLSYKEQQRLTALPDQIAQLEAEQLALSEQLSDPVIFADAKKVLKIQSRLSELESEVEVKLLEWETLESKQ
jgi:ATP-binding cassette subfamily F protein uup